MTTARCRGPGGQPGTNTPAAGEASLRRRSRRDAGRRDVSPAARATCLDGVTWPGAARYAADTLDGRGRVTTETNKRR
jgi:hypothetical protein